ncbi:helix-turn-helix domain-containing protein [Salibacterium aidingense]|uniref:helix-turn-helix domain-containing protein n=1 Tax=Salibacterium aidingense TaxID=384933 RepID=UPI00040111ED|nr:hypothetical protein [Salibacterium aidingense]
MGDNIVLNESEYLEMASRDIGPRIRFIREILHKHFGQIYSGNSVANRVKLVSQSTLTMIEREKTKDVSARALHAICKDFKVNIEIFFDDFYLNEYKPIVINLSANNNKEPASSLSNIDELSVNPFSENEYHYIVHVEQEASNGDRRSIYDGRTKEKLSVDSGRNFIAEIIFSIEKIDTFLNPYYLPLEKSYSPFELAEKHIQLREKNPQYIGWIPKNRLLTSAKQLDHVRDEYTAQLLKQVQHKFEEE